MATAKQNGKEAEIDRVLPPYIPFKTFANFLQKLKDTVIPPRIDSSLLRGYPGSVARQLKGTLKYMGLIDETGNTQASLAPLVKAYGTEQWKDEFGTFLPAVYEAVIGDLDIDTATFGQLQQKFRDQGAEGQMLQKCITFYLSACREAGWSVSPHFTERAPRKQDRKPKSPKSSERQDEERDDRVETPSQSPNTVKFSFPIPDKAAATIFLPAELTQEDWEMIDSMIRAYVQRRAKGK